VAVTAEPDRPAAITAAELAAQASRYGSARPDELERWLLDNGYATAAQDGRLIPTTVAVELGDALEA